MEFKYLNKGRVTRLILLLIQSRTFPMQQVRSNRSQPQSQYYFELRLTKLLVEQLSQKHLRISLFKGLQKLNETKEVIWASEKVVDLEDRSVSLSFYLPEFDKKVSSIYRVALEEIESGAEIGTFNISASAFIVSLVKDNTNTFYRKDKFNNGFTLEYVLFVEKTKADLNQSVRSFEQQDFLPSEVPVHKYSSVLESNHQAGLGELSRRFSSLHQPSLGRRLPRQFNQQESNIESRVNQQSLVITESRKPASIEPTVLLGRKRQSRQGNLRTKLILASLVVAIGIVVYFLVVINQNSKQLEYLKQKLGMA